MPAERESMVFPFRWFDTLSELEENDLRAMLAAIKAYAATGEAPAFKGALKALWNEIRQRIDYDNAKREAITERNRENGQKGGRPKKTQENPKNPLGFSETQENPKKPIAEAEALAEAEAIERPPYNPPPLRNYYGGKGADKGGGHAPRFPQSVDEVIALADRAGAICTKDHAELYLASRQSADWLDRNGKPIRNLAANLKAWLLTYDQIRKDEEKRRGGGKAATGGGADEDAEYRERKAKRDAELRAIYGDAEFERLHREGRL